MDGYVKISKKELLNLRIKAEELSRLEDGCIENYTGYYDALNPEGGEFYSDMVERLTKEVESIEEINSKEL